MAGANLVNEVVRDRSGRFESVVNIYLMTNIHLCYVV